MWNVWTILTVNVGFSCGKCFLNVNKDLFIKIAKLDKH